MEGMLKGDELSHVDRVGERVAGLLVRDVLCCAIVHTIQHHETASAQTVRLRSGRLHVHYTHLNYRCDSSTFFTCEECEITASGRVGKAWVVPT